MFHSIWDEYFLFLVSSTRVTVRSSIKFRRVSCCFNACLLLSHNIIMMQSSLFYWVPTHTFYLTFQSYILQIPCQARRTGRKKWKNFIPELPRVQGRVSFFRRAFRPLSTRISRLGNTLYITKTVPKSTKIPGKTPEFGKFYLVDYEKVEEFSVFTGCTPRILYDAYFRYSSPVSDWCTCFQRQCQL